jgi:hypothetical protein
MHWSTVGEVIESKQRSLRRQRLCLYGHNGDTVSYTWWVLVYKVDQTLHLILLPGVLGCAGMLLATLAY